MHQLFSKKWQLFGKTATNPGNVDKMCYTSLEMIAKKLEKSRKKDTFCPFIAKFKFLSDFIAYFDKKKRVFCQKNGNNSACGQKKS